MANIEKFVRELKKKPGEAARVRKAYQRDGNLAAVFSFLEWRLGQLRQGSASPAKGRPGAGKSKRRT